MFQLCFNLNIIHDSLGKSSRAANQGRVTVNSLALRISHACDLISRNYIWETQMRNIFTNVIFISHVK